MWKVLSLLQSDSIATRKSGFVTDFPFPSRAITKVYGAASGTAVPQPTGREVREH